MVEKDERGRDECGRDSCVSESVWEMILYKCFLSPIYKNTKDNNHKIRIWELQFPFQPSLMQYLHLQCEIFAFNALLDGKDSP